MITDDRGKNTQKRAEKGPEKQPLLDRKKAAKYLNISVSGLDRLIKEKALRAYRIKKRVRLKVSDIQRFLRENATTRK